MPPDRWMISLNPETETLGQMLRRLREERGWTQFDLAALVEPELADDYRAMRNLQSNLSRYETENIKRPDEVLLEKLERIYGLAPDTLAVAHNRSALQRKRVSTPPPNSVAIGPAEPELKEAVQALYLFETEELPAVTEFLRARANLPRAAR